MILTDFGRMRLARTILVIEALIARGLKFDEAVNVLYEREDSEQKEIKDEISFVRLLFGYAVRSRDGVIELRQRNEATIWARSAMPRGGNIPALIEVETNAILRKLGLIS